MIYQKEALLGEIKDRLSACAMRSYLEQGRLSDAEEELFRGLLDIVLDCRLKNMNRERANFPAIDLGDEQAKIAVQVTSTGTRAKVVHTLKEFGEEGLEKRFSRLIVLVVGKKDRAALPQPPEGVCLEWWSLLDLVNRLREAPEGRLERAAAYLRAQVNLSQEEEPLLLPLETSLTGGRFVGREQELEELTDRFSRERIVALSGLGGMGKTELALKFGREHWLGRTHFVRYQGSWFQTAVYAVADGISGLTRQNRPEREVYREVMARLQRCAEHELLILDNADEGSLEELVLELSALPLRVLITTRQEPEDAMKLGRLSEEALFAIFRRHGVELTEEEMRGLISAVDGHTMAVDLMARLLRRERRSDTLIRLQRALSERDLASPEFGKTDASYRMSPSQARINEHLKAVFRVADMTGTEKTVLRFATLLGESGLDSELFVVAAESEAEKLPKKRRWFDFLSKKPEEKPQPIPKIRDVLQDLADKGWLLWEEDDIRIHPVIRLVCMEELKKGDRVFQSFLRGLKLQYDQKQYDAVKFRQMAELFETASAVLEDRDGFWAGEAGYLWNELVDPRRALTCNLQAVEKREREQPDTDSLATAYNNVGNTYGDLGEHEKALEYQLKALGIFEKVLPEDHPHLATSYNNVGSTYYALGDHEKALEYQLKALEILEKVLPEGHPDLATSYNNVGYTYGDLGEHEKDLEYKLKALRIREKVLPEDHPDLAQSYNNVGYTYGALGDHEKTLEYQLKALRIREKVLPENHPDLALSCNNVAWTYHDLGRIDRAAEYMRRAAEIIGRSSLPEGHPNRVNFTRWAERLEREARQAQGGE